MLRMSELIQSIIKGYYYYKEYYYYKGYYIEFVFNYIFKNKTIYLNVIIHI